MKGQQELGVKGSYSLRVFKENGSEVNDKYVPFVQNVITDHGIQEQILDTSLFSGRVRGAVGKGTTAISQTSASLNNLFKSTPTTNDGGVATHTDNGDGTVTSSGIFKRSFSIGDFTGDTISEVGIVDGFGSTLHAGQLIKDSSSNPTTITVLSDEQLVIEYVIEVTSWFTRQELDSFNLTVNGITTTARLFVNPYLRDSNLSNGDVVTIFSGPRPDRIAFGDSTTFELFAIANFGVSWSVNGNVATLPFNYTASPSDFNTTDLKYIPIGSFDTLDPTDPFQEDHSFVLIFDTPVEKTSSQAITIDFSVDVTATRL